MRLYAEVSTQWTLTANSNLNMTAEQGPLSYHQVQQVHSGQEGERTRVILNLGGGFPINHSGQRCGTATSSIEGAERRRGDSTAKPRRGTRDAGKDLYNASLLVRRSSATAWKSTSFSLRIPRTASSALPARPCEDPSSAPTCSLPQASLSFTRLVASTTYTSLGTGK